MYWRPRKDQLELQYRPVFWEAVEEYRDRGLTGLGKIIFGEFNEVENEIDGDKLDTMDMMFFGKAKDGSYAAFSANTLSPLEPGQ